MPKLVGSITQGAANAYVEGSIVTGLSTLSRQAWIIDLIQIEWTPMIINANLASLDLCVSRASKAAMPNVTDRDVLFKYRAGSTFTTSGATHQPMTLAFTPATELVIVEETIYIEMDSDQWSAAGSGYFSLEVHSKTVTETQRLSILASRLGS